MNLPGVIASLTCIMVIWFGIPYLVKRWQIACLRRLCRKSRAIVLTYDDGPGDVLTPALLNVLASTHAHANFFMLGFKMESFPNQVLDVMAQGHAIGSHFFGHLHAWKRNPFKVRNDIQAGFQICRPLFGSDWFRPPYGKITLATLLQTWITRKKLAWWTIDSTDTWANPFAIEKIIGRVKNEGGGVILMHDFDRSDARGHDYVISLTLGLIRLARDEGYNIRMLQDVLVE